MTIKDDDPLAPDALPDPTARLGCPYCGAEIELLLDPGGGPMQQYVEDCEVCCRPLHLRVTRDRGGRANVQADREDD